MVAHEVKKPLSGIKGLPSWGKQSLKKINLLQDYAVNRPCGVDLDKMEGFQDEKPLARREVNIHEILNHCIRLATAGLEAMLYLKGI